MYASPTNYRVFDNPHSGSAQVAAEIAGLIRTRALQGRNVVLGLASGKSTIPVYQDLIYQHREESLSFRNVITFNLAEYHGLPVDHPGGCRSFMQREFFNHVDIRADNIHFLLGNVPESRIALHCAEYEARISAAGGIDYQILGIGRNGRIGFNEPGSPPDSRTRLVKLGSTTRSDVMMDFDHALEKVPKHAISVGCGTLLESRKTALLAWGALKARIVRKALEEPVTQKNCASYFRRHPASQFFLDQPAASALKPKGGPDQAMA